MLHELLVRGPFQERVRDGAEEHFGLVDPRVDERVALADVAVDDAHAALEQADARDRAEVDDADVRDEIGRVELHLLEERAGGAEEAEKQDARGAVPARRGVRVLDFGVVVEVAQAEALQPRNGAADDAVRLLDPDRRQRGEEHESERDHAGRRRCSKSDATRRRASARRARIR